MKRPCLLCIAVSRCDYNDDPLCAFTIFENVKTSEAGQTITFGTMCIGNSGSVMEHHPLYTWKFVLSPRSANNTCTSSTVYCPPRSEHARLAVTLRCWRPWSKDTNSGGTGWSGAPCMFRKDCYRRYYSMVLLHGQRTTML